MILSLALWIAKTNSSLAGFIVSFPLSTMIVLAISKLQDPDSTHPEKLAKSILVGIPASLVFFIPFLLSGRFKISFWPSYFSGIGLLAVAFVVHRWITLYWLS